MLEGYRAEAKVSAILGGLGFREQDFRRSTEEFSGGWQMRIALSKILLRDPDVLSGSTSRRIILTCKLLSG